MHTFESIRVRLEEAAEAAEKKRQREYFGRLISLLQALESRELDPQPFAEFLDSIDHLLDEDASVTKIFRVHERIKSYLEKEHKLVVPGHYQTMWMALGMSAFGLPLGMAFAFALDNFAFFAIGLPIGMSIGIAVGSAQDRKAKEEGRVLDVPGEDGADQE